MVRGIKDSKVISRKKIDETFSGLLDRLEDNKGDFRAASFHLGSLGRDPESYFETRLRTCKGESPSKGFIGNLRRAIGKKSSKFPKSPKPPKPVDKDNLSYSGDEIRATADLGKTFEDKRQEFCLDSLGAEIEDEILESFDAPVEVSEFAEVAYVSEEEEFKLETKFEKDIEEIVKERWRYLVMQFGGVFLTEIRPNKCFVGSKTLADMLITYSNGRYGLNKQILGNYLKKNSRNGGKVQVHFSDIMFNPKTKDYDLFSITSGDIEKAGIFVDLADFLRRYNKNEMTVIPVHLPYYEKLKYKGDVFEFGNKDEDGEREALFKADNVLKYLDGKLGGNIKLALETGNGISKKKPKDDPEGEIVYGLLYDRYYFQTLMKGRKDFVNICEDVGHLNIGDAGADWRDYLIEPISEFHVSGNNGKEDEHTVATPRTLRNYDKIMSFLKFYSGNICAEIGRGELTPEVFLKGVKNLAYTLFSEPTEKDFKNLKETERYVKITFDSEIDRENFNEKRYKKYLEYVG